MSKTEVPYYEYFTGCVPNGSIFWMNVKQLREIVEKVDDEDVDEGLGTIVEVCFIGLIAYFEAFFKDHFASLINICPQLLLGLKRNSGIDTNIDIVDLLALDDSIMHKLGFLLVEHYDFGNAKRINSFYHGLLSITPFSKDEIARYDQLLRDRNLLVHQGGIFTMKYIRQEFQIQADKPRAFQDSLIVTRRKFFETALFLEGIANKTSNAAKSAVANFIETKGIVLSDEKIKALRWL